jgi:hypothetical protein
MDKSVLVGQNRSLVLNLIKELQGQQVCNPPSLPVFFVDSKKFNTDQVTMAESSRFHKFVAGVNPLSTQNIVTPHVQYLRIDKERRNHFLVETRYEGNTRIQRYEDHESEKRTGYDVQTITYSDWTAINSREIRHYRSSRIETKTVSVKTTTIPIYYMEHYCQPRYVICAPRRTRQVQCGVRVMKTMQELVREGHTDYDGTVSYGDWRVIREWAC